MIEPNSESAQGKTIFRNGDEGIHAPMLLKPGLFPTSARASSPVWDRPTVLVGLHQARVTKRTSCPLYKNVAADVSRLKLPSLARVFERVAEKNDPAHAGCYGKSELVRSE